MVHISKCTHKELEEEEEEEEMKPRAMLYLGGFGNSGNIQINSSSSKRFND